MKTDLFGAVSPDPSTVAIGAFDGLHLGHQHIIRSTVNEAKANGWTSCAILFDPLPAQFFGRIAPDERILLHEEQERMLRQLGIDRTIVLPFTQEIADLTPEEFLSAMQEALHCRKIFMGEDFSLGKDRSGTPEYLARLGSSFGFTVNVIPKDVMDGDVISSTRIRSMLHSGLIEEANRLLGYSFYFSGEIIHGKARGRKLGFPTLNVKIPDGKIKLPNGVYAVNVLIEGEQFASVTNIGVRPTFEPENRNIITESYLLNASGDFYGDSVRLEFMKMLREEIRFSSADALREQISRDIETAKKILL